ncbi:hypothetical protein QCF01_14995, partial [Staphylococcus aureus]|nr:hypothetical protein [Staphylococcus aureus]
GDTMLVMVYLRVPNATDAAPVIIPIGAGGSQPPYAAGNTNISVQLAGAKQVIEVRPAFPLDLGAGVRPVDTTTPLMAISRRRSVITPASLAAFQTSSPAREVAGRGPDGGMSPLASGALRNPCQRRSVAFDFAQAERRLDAPP